MIEVLEKLVFDLRRLKRFETATKALLETRSNDKSLFTTVRLKEFRKLEDVLNSNQSKLRD